MSEVKDVKEVKVELTPEEVEVLKEIAQNQMAYSRVWRKVRGFGIAVSSALVAYMILFENAIDWLKAKLGL